MAPNECYKNKFLKSDKQIILRVKYLYPLTV